ncbi:ketosynthase chain-length factor [Pseudonocardia endophytica]|uniref:Act minimal PKS chain-length factor (CLF/KS beta) n=1 Tax=Pseudonocardia endophytica TaxID=401976 RepID=A0A4R1HK33_PSEEN|nr:ketosynthase chain-length factor [Pseudonocardia endophytica]TCK22218.1 act minimal PKS chain-length factor (CLF/KS beta) [Pseudonocardia endophytica]
MTVLESRPQAHADGQSATTTPVTVTGIGVAAPTGVGTERFWRATLDGTSAIGPITTFDTDGYPVRLAGEIGDVEHADRVAKRLMPQTDRITRIALIAADLALDDAGVDPDALSDYAMGVATTSATGGLEFGQRELEKLWGSGWQSVSAYMSFAWYYAVHTGQISIKNGMRGPGGVVVSEQAGGLDMLSFARRRVRRGTPVMTTGGLDSMLCPYGVAIQGTDPDVSVRTDPARAYLPFEADASGYVPGEGGAILVVEDTGAARARGAGAGYGTVAGYGAAFDPAPSTSGGAGLARAARTALRDAGIAAADVDVVYADAAGSPALDDAEATALTALFGERGVPVAAPKAAYGRLLSGGAPVDVVSALLTLRDGVVPPTVNVRPDAVDPRVDLVTGGPRPVPAATAMVLARGRGGFASAVVLTR